MPIFLEWDIKKIYNTLYYSQERRNNTDYVNNVITQRLTLTDFTGGLYSRNYNCSI